MTSPSAPPLHKQLRTIRRAYGAAAACAALIAAGAAAMPGGAAGAAAAAAAAAIALAAWTLHAKVLRKKKPLDPDAEFGRGIRLLLSNDRFGAESAFRDLVARDPRDVEATVYLGLVLREHGDARGAARVLRRACRIDLGRKWGREILELLEPLR